MNKKNNHRVLKFLYKKNKEEAPIGLKGKKTKELYLFHFLGYGCRLYIVRLKGSSILVFCPMVMELLMEGICLAIWGWGKGLKGFKKRF